MLMMLVQIRYRALVYAWLKYARLPEMAGVGLQKQTFVAAGEGEFTFTCQGVPRGPSFTIYKM